MECTASRRWGIFKNYTASKIRVMSSLWHAYPDRSPEVYGTLKTLALIRIPPYIFRWMVIRAP